METMLKGCRLALPLAIAGLLLCGCQSGPIEASAQAPRLIMDQGLTQQIERNIKEVQGQGHALLTVGASHHQITPDLFSGNMYLVARRLQDQGHEVYAVGGAVRDLIMGKSPNDFDLLTSATYDEVRAACAGMTITDHSIPNGQVFLVARLEGDNIDISSLHNVPPAFLGKPYPGVGKGIFAPDLLSDSYQRDLPINALYYRLSDGAILDYHGGIYGIVHQVMDTTYEPWLEFANKPANAVRAVRFSARYGMPFTERVAQDLEVNFPRYLRMLDKAELGREMKKFHHTGYTVALWDALGKWHGLEALLKPCGALVNDPAYQAYMRRTLGMLDEAYGKKDGDYTTVFMGAALWPAIERRLKRGASFKRAMKAVLDEQEQGVIFARGERKALEAFLTSEYLLTHPGQSQRALGAQDSYEPALLLLRSRAVDDPSLKGALQSHGAQALPGAA
ncbi:MAG: hypothetical protein K6A65_05675 [Succinivibrionaceae bacterium]|nr:hypothetical protein [Succinivibrionaceae bacterium]